MILYVQTHEKYPEEKCATVAVPSANIQFDLWKGSHKRHELGIHLNCTDIDTGAGAVVHFCLGIYHITTAHTADNIIATIEEILGPAGYNIREFVNSGSSDNATNVVSAVKRMRLTQVGCQAHKVNLAVKLCGGEVAQLEAPR